MNRVSLHLRITRNLYDVLLRTVRLNRCFVQCFLLSYPRQQHLIINRSEQSALLELIYLYSVKIYVHAPYWINLCSEDTIGTQKMLNAEVRKVRAIGAYAYVMHLGHSNDASDVQLLLKRVEQHVMYLVSCFPGIQFILENSSYNAANQGINLQDFSSLFSSLRDCLTLSFCLDTAHAYSAGYDIARSSEYDRLMYDLDQYIGLNRVSLIHCNDTLQPIGSTQDIHHRPGQGLIGKQALQRLLNDTSFKSVSIILELANLDFKQQEMILQEVEQWIE